MGMIKLNTEARSFELAVADAEAIRQLNERKRSVVYLLHFDVPYKHARHYVGFCTSYEGLETRFEHHANGNGSRLLKAVGKGFKLARLWYGSRDDERAIKNTHHTPEFCPMCNTKPRERIGLEEIKL